MSSSTNVIESDPSLLYSYKTYKGNRPVVLELWGFKERISRGVVKDATGKQISEIPPTRILIGKSEAVTGQALLAYLKTSNLSAVLDIQGREEVARLVPIVGGDHNSSCVEDERDSVQGSVVDLNGDQTVSQPPLDSDFLEDIKRNYRTKKDLSEFAATLFSNGSRSFKNSHYQDAIAWFNKALFVQILLEDKWNVGVCYGNLGNAYQSIGEHYKAIEYHERRKEIAREVEDRAGEGSAYSNLGIAFYSLGIYRKSIQHIEKSLEIAKESKDRAGEGTAYCNLGSAYCSLGDYRSAVDNHERHLQIGIELKSRSSEGRAYGNLGNVYFCLGDYQKALRYYGLRLEIAKELKDRGAMGVAYGNLGTVHRALEDYQKAIEHHEKHQEIAKEIGNRMGEAAAYGSLGVVYQKLGEYRKAIEYHEKRLMISVAMGDRAGEGNACGNLGNAYSSLEEYQNAVKYYERGLQIAKGIGDQVTEAKANYNLGLSFYQQKEYSKSEEAFVQSISIFSGIEEGLGREDWKISIFEEQANAYLGLQHCYITGNKVERALEICEKGQARSLFDLYCTRLGLSKEACRKRENVTFDQIQKIAGREKTSFVYFSNPSGNDLHVWVVKSDGVYSEKSELPEDFRAEALSLFKEDSCRRSLIASYLPVRVDFSKLEHDFEQRYDKKKPDPNVRLLEGLEKCYQALITPILKWLDGKQLTIITDAAMQDIPFAALFKNGSEGKEYLTDKYTISMAPSFRIFDLLHELKPKKDGSALIISDPAINEMRLEGAKNEGEALSKKIPNLKLLCEGSATISAVKESASDFSILHFACHGSPDERINKDSVFEGALCLTDGNGGKEMLYADEIQKLNLKADLVFLSACQTGKGALRREGVIGLSRAFLSAGVPSVIATHWSISDHVTQEIVSDFYTNFLDKKMTKAEALRKAILVQRKAHPDNPYLWGAFFLVGK